MRILSIIGGLTAILLLVVNEVLILDTARARVGKPYLSTQLVNFDRGSSRLSGKLTDDAVQLVMVTGVPERYGPELGITFPNPAEQNLMNATIEKLKQFDPAYGTQKITLTDDLKKRYTNIGLRISCEFCCGAKAIVFENGEAACGCAHSQAMRGLAAYLLQNHAAEYTDDQILRELARWKGLFFPKQMVTKLMQQVGSGNYTPDIAALLIGVPEQKLKEWGAVGAVNVPGALQQLPDMSGGC